MISEPRVPQGKQLTEWLRNPFLLLLVSWKRIAFAGPR